MHFVEVSVILSKSDFKEDFLIKTTVQSKMSFIFFLFDIVFITKVVLDYLE